MPQCVLSLPFTCTDWVPSCPRPGLICCLAASCYAGTTAVRMAGRPCNCTALCQSFRSAFLRQQSLQEDEDSMARGQCWVGTGRLAAAERISSVVLPSQPLTYTPSGERIYFLAHLKYLKFSFDTPTSPQSPEQCQSGACNLFCTRCAWSCGMEQVLRYRRRCGGQHPTCCSR